MTVLGSSQTRTDGVDAERYLIISADTHAVVPKEVFRPYVEKSYLADFEDEIRFVTEERAICRAGYRAFLDHRDEETEDERYYYWNRAAEEAEAARVWEPKNWVAMNEAEGVVGSVIFPAGNSSRPPWEGFARPVDNVALRGAGKRAYNRWLADFCSELPEQLAGVAITPTLEDVKAAVAEIEWASEHGLRGGIWLSPTVAADRPGLHDPMYDPIWRACEQTGLPVNFHIDFGGGGSPNTTLYGTGPLAWAIAFHDAPPTYRPLWFLILGGVFERFPLLKVGFTEQLAKWIPYELERLQDVFDDSTFTAANRLREVRRALSLTPLEYWRRNCFVGASFMSRAEAAARHDIGLENILWGSDFPHPEGTSPVTQEALRFAFANVPATELRLILGENAARVYGFDLVKLAPIADRVGPTTQEVARPLQEPPSKYADKLVFGRGRF